MSDVEYSILGPLSVRLTADAEPIEFSERHGVLLGRLLVEPGTTFSWEALSRDVWGEEVDLTDPRNAVQQAVGRVRRQLRGAASQLVTAGAAYRLEVERLSIDAERFKLLTRRARALAEGQPRVARAMLEEALSSWRGPLLGEHVDRRWVAAYAAELETMRSGAEVTLNEVWFALGEHEELECSLRKQLVMHPSDERRHRQLIRTLEATGRIAEAGAAYRDAFDALGTLSADMRRFGDRIGRRVPAKAQTPTLVNLGREHRDPVLLHAIPAPPRADAPWLGTLTLVVDQARGELDLLGGERAVAMLPDPSSAERVARRLAEDGRLRCAVALHVGGSWRFGDRLIGPGVERCQLLADAAVPGQVLVSTSASDMYWPVSTLRYVGEQRFEDLLTSEPVFELPGLAHRVDSPSAHDLSRRPHNLPVQQTRFVGRTATVAELSRNVTAGELITLIGAGGCGKTRLALQLAARRISAFPDGTWFVGLAELPAGADVETLTMAIVSSLSATPLRNETARETVVRHLVDRVTVLILDNCEHVLDACRDLVAEMRARCPQTCLIATSRQPLGIRGERQNRIPSMATEPVRVHDDPPDAVELLLERVGSLPDAPADDLLRDADRICRALDGLPLAIELAASQVARRGLDGVAAEVEAMLSGERKLDSFVSHDPDRLPRQRTIEATIRWSYDLLDERQREVLRRLAIFRGSFGLAEAEAVADGGVFSFGEVADVVSRLVDCSMVVAQPPLGGTARLLLRPPIRAFALSELRSGGDYAQARRAHASVYSALASRTAPMLFGSDEQAGLDRLDADHDNLCAALELLVEDSRARDALALVGALWWYWFSRGHFEEGGRSIRTVLDLDARLSRERVRALRAGSHLAWWRGDYTETDRYNVELESCALAIDDAWGLAWAPMGQGAVLMFGQPRRALGLFESSRHRFEVLGREWEAAYALQLVGAAHWFAGDERAAGAAYEEAASTFERVGHGSVLASVRRGAGLMAARCGRRVRGTALCKQALVFSEAIGDRAGSAQALNFLAVIASEENDLELTAERHASALVYAREVGELWAICSALDGIAAVACASGELQLSARLFARSDALAKRSGYRRSTHEEDLRAADARALQARLDASELDRAMVEGEVMSVADAVAAALAFSKRYAGG